MWAGHRFAVPATATIEEECSNAHFDGDSVLLYEEKDVSLRRKTLEGIDCVMKTYFYSDREGYKDIRARARREMVTFERLKDIQGIMIPRVVWKGDMVSGAADCVGWEFCGNFLPPRITKATRDAFLDLVHALHARGVIHGSLRRRMSYMFDEKTKKPYLANFEYAVFREELEVVSHVSEWDEMVAADLKRFERRMEENVDIYENEEELLKAVKEAEEEAAERKRKKKEEEEEAKAKEKVSA